MRLCKPGAAAGLISGLGSGSPPPCVRVVTRSTSLSGPESLIEHRASIEGSQSRAPQARCAVSTGLEQADDLIFDLAQALERCI
jgi:cystathionine beta-lyase/cystathionine gamma-synthase